MKTKLPKTKILRIRGGEIYFQQIELQDGTYWEIYQKDQSAIFKHCHDTRFKAMGTVRTSPTLPSYETALFPIPDDFTTDLLTPYARLEYATGHTPPRSFNWR